MRSLAQLNERLTELFLMLHEIQSVQSCPNHSRKEKKQYHRLAQSLAFAIEHIQWALGLREHTVLDAYKAAPQ
jgi:hypothetical protein